MVIRERMVELRDQEEQARQEREQTERADRLRAQEKARRKDQIYEESRDAAILKHRELFEVLREIGVIGMLEEMTSPQKIETKLTSQEIEDRDKELTEDMLQRRKRQVDDKGSLSKMIGIQPVGGNWTGVILSPERLKDGPADKTLRIKLIKLGNTLFDIGQFPEKSVLVSYSDDNILEIRGKEETFQGIVTKENSDLRALEDALALAFFMPFEQRGEKPLQPFEPPGERVYRGENSS